MTATYYILYILLFNNYDFSIKMDNVEIMLILFAIVITGYTACKLGYMDEQFDKKLSCIVVDITCPALILSSVMGDELPDRSLIIPLLTISTLTYIILTAVAIYVPRLISKNRDEDGIIGFATMFGNVGFIGYPIAASIFGNKAIFYAAILNVANTFFVFSIGKSLITGNKQRFNLDIKTLFCPGLVAAYLSIIFVTLGIDFIPKIISQPITMIGNITVPASLLIIGSAMARLPKRYMLGNRKVYITSLLRLFVIPISIFFLFKFLGFDSLVTGLNAVIIGMPVATFGTIFCLKYGRDTTLITEITFITSVMSIASIPLLAQIVT